MSEREPMTESADCGTDAAAYVLGALEPDEAERFERHLEGCVVCRDEVAALQATVDALPMAAPQVALPRSLRRRILKDASRDSSPARLSAPRWRPALAGVAVVAALVGVIVAVGLGGGSGGATRTVAARVLGLPGTAYLAIAGSRAVLVVNHLPSPPADKVYEVWVKRPNEPPQPTSALFTVTPAGAQRVPVPGDITGVREVLVTPERAGGSSVPTHAPVIDASLPA
jgi:anti-sigma-K factor RskA